MKEFNFFLKLLEQNYTLNRNDYALLSAMDLANLRERCKDLSEMNNCDNIELLYDPIFESLVQSTLAHFLYVHKYNVEVNPDRMPLHPNYVFFHFLDKLAANKATVTLGSFQLVKLESTTTIFDVERLKRVIRERISNPFLRSLMYSFISKMQFTNDLNYLNNKLKPTRGIGLLYFVYMDLYLEFLDQFILDCINKKNTTKCGCFWVRCLDYAIVGFSDQKDIPRFNKVLKMESVLSAFGLTASVRTGNRGGRVLRPSKGKLYIDTDGHLKWERPESIVKLD